MASMYVVYNGKNLYHNWTQSGSEKTSYTTNEKGWVEGPQFHGWFKRIFLKETVHLRHQPRMLICDGHVSHPILALIQEAKDNNVIIPLDWSVFRPVKL